MTVEKSDPGSHWPDSDTFREDEGKGKLILQRRVVVFWVLVVLLPLALVRFALFYAFPQQMNGEPGVSAEVEQLLRTVNLTSTQPPKAEECDLLQGDWIPDEPGPKYSNETCNHIQGHQNCLKNGRPDNGYMYWRWKPKDCELPRFDPDLFIRLMRGKLIAFVGDSIARNHMQALLCTLSQIEKPIKTYTDEGDRHVRWWFPTNNFTVSTFWSPYLVLQEDDKNGHSQLFLDVLDPVWLNNSTEFDVLLLSSGQWFFKSNLFFKNNSLIGCHSCSAFSNATSLGFYFAYREVMRYVLEQVDSMIEFSGVKAAILRTFSPDHFEDGRWDNGGSCKRTVPFGSNVTLPENSLTYEMHRIQKEVFGELFGGGNSTKKRRVEMVDVTRISYLRPDGHPGPYRNFQPFSKEFVGHVQNDCLHWCIPGPVDTWNDMVLETLRRKME